MTGLILCSLLPAAAFGQQPGPQQGGPPSVASEPPPEPGAEELNAASRKGDVEAVRALLDKGISPDAKWRYGMTALFPACDRGHLEVVKLLLERGANVNVRDSFYGQTPFQSALGKGHVEIVRLLFAKGAGNAGDVLYTAVGRGNADIAQMALGRGGIPAETMTGALLRAKRASRTELVNLLRAAGAQPPSWNLDEPSLAIYAGTFGEQNPVRFEVREGTLIARVGPQQFHLFPLDDKTFKLEENNNIVIAFQVQEGQVTGLVLKQAGQPDATLKKVEGKQ
jgi:hypothetical protein